MKYVLAVSALFFTLSIYSQKPNGFSMQINYGLNGSFSVRDYDEIGGPPNKKYFLKKDFVGTVAGIAVDYHTRKNSFMLEFSHTINKGRKNYADTISGAEIYLSDFVLREIDYIFSLGYGRKFKSKSVNFEIDAGLTMIYDVHQSIEIYEWPEAIIISETNYKNSNSVQGGAFFGLSMQRKIDTKFDLGIKSRVYYLISTRSWQAITLTPTLTYHFQKKSPRANPETLPPGRL